MFSSPNPIQQEWLAWPSFSGNASVSECLFHARAFGHELTDTELDLSALSRPDTVTCLLHACLVDSQGQHFAMEDIWDWSVKLRLQGVLAIAAATLGTRFNLTSHCTRQGCGEQLEVELQLHDFIDTDDEMNMCCDPEPDTQLVVRLPSGRDQRNWQQSASACDYDTTLRQMGRTLISQCNGQPLADSISFPDRWLDSIEEVLEEADRLTALSLTTRCPFCDADNEIELDLETSLLNLLVTRQHGLLEDIHLLASTYHWSEEEIVRLPLSRRSFYIERITGEPKR